MFTGNNDVNKFRAWQMYFCEKTRSFDTRIRMEVCGYTKVKGVEKQKKGVTFGILDANHGETQDE
jgi:hypothetical protein